MKNLAISRANGAFLPLVMVASAMTMLWLLWRYPIQTSIMALIALAALGLSAHSARQSESDGGLEPESQDDGLGSH